MNTLQYLKKKYPNGKIKASYRQLEEVEKLNRKECLELRAISVDNYIDVEDLAHLLDQI